MDSTKRLLLKYLPPARCWWSSSHNIALISKQLLPTMGFFDFFHELTTTGPQLHRRHPDPLLKLFTTPKAIQHDVSFDLTTTISYSSSNAPPYYTPRPLAGRPLSAMPLELVLSIIEAACSDDEHNSFLPSCALVCRAWSSAAQKLLFRYVTLRTQSAFESFSRAVDRSTAHGCVLADAVRRLYVVLDHNQPSSLHQHSFALAFTMCPNLCELNLSLYGCAAPGVDIVGVPDILRMRRPAPSFDARTLSLLKSGPKITTLQFSNWSENQQSIVQLLDVWPSIKSLSIGGTLPQIPPNSPEPFSCALEELRLNFQTSPSIDFMKWLLHSSAGTLRVLDFERDPSTDLLDFLTRAHGRTLQSMTLPVYSSPEHALSVNRCTRLRTLRTNHPSTQPLLYKRLPESLEHVAIGLDRDTALQPVIDIVKTRDTLKAVTVHLWRGGEKHKLLNALKITCAYRGIELRMSNDVNRFRTLAVSKLPFFFEFQPYRDHPLWSQDFRNGSPSSRTYNMPSWF